MDDSVVFIHKSYIFTAWSICVNVITWRKIYT